MYKVLVTQHDVSDEIVGIDFWEVERMPDPKELGDDVLRRFGNCHTALVSINVDELPYPIFVIMVEGVHHGEQN